MRARRTHFLYHGTLLYNFDLSLIETCLHSPPRQPDYRAERSHAAFLTNLPVARPSLVAAIDRAWPTHGELSEMPTAKIDELIATRFGQRSWNLEFP
jgi:lipoate-protein ligase A